MTNKTVILDCTLRDGGYYNDWDFSLPLINDYLDAMESIGVDFVEIGFRTLQNEGFKGALAFSSEEFLSALNIPPSLKNRLGVMVNGSEIIEKSTQEQRLRQLFTPKNKSLITLVRIACHIHEFESCLPAANWLSDQGYTVGFNLMQVADKSHDEITRLASLASEYPIDVLYFADSMGSVRPDQIGSLVNAFKQGWGGELGVHTHDNMGFAISNTLCAIEAGVTWIDSTVTGMGRGPGNAKTEYVISELGKLGSNDERAAKLYSVIRQHFRPLNKKYEWGTNHYYYLAGKYGIHPSYVQKMLQDSRYNDSDILTVIHHLKAVGGAKFDPKKLYDAKSTHDSSNVNGLDKRWEPSEIFKNRTVLILGSGSGVDKYSKPLESLIKKYDLVVMALNAQSGIEESLIEIRAACHQLRLLADFSAHSTFPQPLMTPTDRLPPDVKGALSSTGLLNYGLQISGNALFKFHQDYCEVPSSLVLCYALAAATSGIAKEILLAGFDGYESGDPRNEETESIFESYRQSNGSLNITSITPTKYRIPTKSLYGGLLC